MSPSLSVLSSFRRCFAVASAPLAAAGGSLGILAYLADVGGEVKTATLAGVQPLHEAAGAGHLAQRYGVPHRF